MSEDRCQIADDRKQRSDNLEVGMRKWELLCIAQSVNVDRKVQVEQLGKKLELLLGAGFFRELQCPSRATVYSGENPHPQQQKKKNCAKNLVFFGGGVFLPFFTGPLTQNFFPRKNPPPTTSKLKLGSQ
jgi:hypothetical protein